MVKSNNSYKILGIACDEYGNPQISDEDVGKRYAELLIKSFVNYNMEMLIIQEEKNKKNELEEQGMSEEEISKIAKRYSRSPEMQVKLRASEEKDKRFISDYLGINYRKSEKSKTGKNTIKDFVNELSKQKNIESIINQIENLVYNHQFLQQHEVYRDTLELYKNAYRKIKDSQRRRNYNQELKESKDEHEKQKEIHIERKEYSTPDTTFLGIHKNQNADSNFKMLYGDNKRVLLSSNRYIILKTKNQEQISDIKSKASLEAQKLIEYTVLTRKEGKMNSVKFISGTEIEQFFARKDKKLQDKKTYFRAILMALKNKIATHRPMLGEIKRKSGENSNQNEFEELYNIDLAEKVKEFEEENRGENKNTWVR